MEWITGLKTAINYMEENLLCDIGAEEIAKVVHISSFYFQKGFKIMTGYTINEYIRNRRMYLAGLDVIRKEGKIIDLAYKYGYETPESFTKAFTRFHGLSPVQLKEEPYRIKTFLPLTVEVIIKGGYKMDYVVEKMEAIKLIGFERLFSYESSYQEIPKFWDELFEKYPAPVSASKQCGGEPEQTAAECMIGEFGVCMDDEPETDKFRYLVAGIYHGGEVPEGMKIVEIPGCEWAKFRCTGALPDALQTVNTRIFREWLPDNPEFEIAAGLNLEWYAKGDTRSPDYESAVWIPVKRKKGIV